jgi:D-alanine-D-alanine ligase
MQKVLLLFGGESSEHDVSIVSARNIAKAIDRTKYELSFGFIDRGGQWWSVKDIVESVPEGAQRLLPRIGEGSFTVEGGDVLTPDVVFPVLHGKNGEDGSVQALAQLLHIPVVGNDMTASALAMNKHLTKQLASAHNIKVVSYGLHYRENAMPKFAETAEALGETVFVKPAGSGSSVGVSKASNQEELEAAITEAHKHDRMVLIEKAVDARELEVAVLGNFPNIEASGVGEVKPQGDFYSYESKYDEGSTSEVVIPADLAPEIAERLRTDAQRMFIILGASGMARVDFFLDRNDGEIYLNEVNTIPGFTDISMYPKLWDQAGVSYSDLIDRLIQLALSR